MVEKYASSNHPLKKAGSFGSAFIIRLFDNCYRNLNIRRLKNLEYRFFNKGKSFFGGFPPFPVIEYLYYESDLQLT